MEWNLYRTTNLFCPDVDPKRANEFYRLLKYEISRRSQLFPPNYDAICFSLIGDDDSFSDNNNVDSNSQGSHLCDPADLSVCASVPPCCSPFHLVGGFAPHSGGQYKYADRNLRIVT
uniref:Uncharacterized protein n=1 Tax=Megaselia scalaris TaxID=36166 RepID=T1GGA8_MEGSC